ncbi:glycosyltransferase family 4 protein [Salinibacter ruber]|uniref:glycosyltransferase family 4 protein n=1 Tax=Salinibacter ruber TaxID=146919 RepID=UPI0020741B2B|nr:glycosyltransferase family 4 protein [Salinibacter ruber]
MHILHLTATLSFGGAQKITVGLAEQAVNHGHEASILTVTSGNDFAERLQEAGISFRTLGYEGSFTPRNLLSILRLRREMVETVHQIDPDVIHEQLFIPKILAIGMSDIAGRPVVHTQQDSSPWWSRGGAYAYLQTLIERSFSKRIVNENVAVSASVLEEMKDYGLVQEEEGTVIHNFTEITPAEPDEISVLGDGPLKLFMVTRLTWEKKGLDTAVDILARLRDQNEDVRLVVVGDGPDREKMAAYADEREVRQAIEFRGYQENVRSQYREADLLLMPSRWEGLSLTATEATAMGVPVVGSQIGGICEVVEHGETGFTSPPENARSFVEHIKRLMHAPELYQRFSKSGIRRVQNHFTPESAFEAYEEVYRNADVTNNNQY